MRGSEEATEFDEFGSKKYVSGEICTKKQG
jgi:hypothetical protein